MAYPTDDQPARPPDESRSSTPRIIRQDGSLRSRWRETKATVFAFIETLLPRHAGPCAGDPVLNEATEIFLKHLQVLPARPLTGTEGHLHVREPGTCERNPERTRRVLSGKSDGEPRERVPTKVGDFMKGELDKLQAKVRESNEAVERYRNAERCSSKASSRAAKLFSTRNS